MAAWLTSLIGPKGEKGDKGDKGDKGNKGDTGSTGKSAFELAQENGFKGTLTEWLASLVGAKGDKGEKGEQGAQGEKGDKGDQGVQGIQGETGATGTTGRGIAKTYIDDNGNLVVEYTDETEDNLGKIPSGYSSDSGTCELVEGVTGNVRWYRQGELCYIFIEDVTIPADLIDNHTYYTFCKNMDIPKMKNNTLDYYGFLHDAKKYVELGYIDSIGYFLEIFGATTHTKATISSAVIVYPCVIPEE